MGTLLIGVLAVLQGALSVAEGDESSERPTTAQADRITVYSVPLRCPLVDGLGCGSAAKPVLSELEQKPGVAEAWLDHSGTKLALVWKENTGASKRAKVIAAVSETTKLNELSSSAREIALKEIPPGPRWYRARDVDELSREEAESVTRRLLDSMNAAEPLPKEKRDLLWTSFTDTLKRRFIHGGMSDREVSKELFDAARQHVGPKGIEALEKTILEACCAAPAK
jgi:hypothetical protein